MDKTQSRVYKVLGFLGKRCPIKGKHYHDYLLLIAMYFLSCNIEFEFDLTAVTFSRTRSCTWKAEDFVAY